MEDSEKSLFNSGLAKLERIHKIRIKLFEFRIMDDWENVADSLVCWRNEMDYGMLPEEQHQADNLEPRIDALIASPDRSNILKKRITEYERLLGRIEDRLGLGMPRLASQMSAARL